jgi:hypothetical protein
MQLSYINNILKLYSFDNCKTALTPFNSKLVLQKNPDEVPASADTVTAFQRRIRSLIWLSISTRPDISFAVAKLAHFAINPSKDHVAALSRIFHYL